MVHAVVDVQSSGRPIRFGPLQPGQPPSSVPAFRHLTKDDNGLTAEWRGAVWLNPPFSSKRPWYERMVAHGNGIALMPARTETHDLQTYMQAAQALLFLRGRIYFERGYRPGGNGIGGVTTTPPFGIVLCAYGADMAIALLNSRLLGVRKQGLLISYFMRGAQVSKYAENTKVPVENSKNEIEKILKRFGADQFGYGSKEDGAVIRVPSRQPPRPVSAAVARTETAIPQKGRPRARDSPPLALSDHVH